MTTFLIIVLTVAVAAIYSAVAESRRVAAMSPEARSAYLARKREAAETTLHGPVNFAMVCPHCHQKDRVRTIPVDRKKGISGGKATAAVLTGGVSMLATGLSRKEHLTRARCGNCLNAWDF